MTKRMVAEPLRDSACRYSPRSSLMVRGSSGSRSPAMGPAGPGSRRGGAAAGGGGGGEGVWLDFGEGEAGEPGEFAGMWGDDGWDVEESGPVLDAGEVVEGVGVEDEGVERRPLPLLGGGWTPPPCPSWAGLNPAHTPASCFSMGRRALRKAWG